MEEAATEMEVSKSQMYRPLEVTSDLLQSEGRDSILLLDVVSVFFECLKDEVDEDVV